MSYSLFTFQILLHYVSFFVFFLFFLRRMYILLVYYRQDYYYFFLSHHLNIDYKQLLWYPSNGCHLNYF